MGLSLWQWEGVPNESTVNRYFRIATRSGGMFLKSLSPFASDQICPPLLTQNGDTTRESIHAIFTLSRCRNTLKAQALGLERQARSL